MTLTALASALASVSSSIIGRRTFVAQATCNGLLPLCEVALTHAPAATASSANCSAAAAAARLASGSTKVPWTQCPVPCTLASGSSKGPLGGWAGAAEGAAAEDGREQAAAGARGSAAVAARAWSNVAPSVGSGSSISSPALPSHQGARTDGW